MASIEVGITRFYVFTSDLLKIIVLWYVTPCQCVTVYQLTRCNVPEDFNLRVRITLELRSCKNCNIYHLSYFTPVSCVNDKTVASVDIFLFSMFILENLSQVNRRSH